MTQKSIKNSITEQHVITAQKQWSNAIINIGKAYINKQDYKTIAENAITQLYADNANNILFKPTLASEIPFRHNFNDTLSYFISGQCKEDHGFALKPWQNIQFLQQKIYCQNNFALAMGHYKFSEYQNKTNITVEFSFAYILNQNNQLRIKLHHSSIPYQNK